jgi:2-(1,2-epoxy-1,2-dihydrophenyl)acetyl-CoA isomerase
LEGVVDQITPEECLLIERHAGWAKLTLNRPSKRNAFNTALHHALHAAFDELGADDSCRAVLLTGAGAGFCSGADLSDRVGISETFDLGVPIDTLYNPLIRRIRALRKPVVCAVNGAAAGAGANLALACDIVIAAKSAFFMQAFVKIGLIPDCGGTYFLPRLIGDARARAAMMLAEPISGQQAADWGMIWQAVEDSELQTMAEALTQRLASMPTQSLALMKQALNASGGNGMDAQLDLERDLQRIAGRTGDYREGVAAFVEKRAPNFTGKP